MGQIATGLCSCGFISNNLILGGGIYSDSNHFPAYCAEGAHIIAINLKAETYRCKDKNHLSAPIPYFDAQLCKSEKVISADFNQDELSALSSERVFFCPQCKEFNLKFQGVGLWD